LEEGELLMQSLNSSTHSTPSSTPKLRQPMCVSSDISSFRFGALSSTTSTRAPARNAPLSPGAALPLDTRAGPSGPLPDTPLLPPAAVALLVLLLCCPTLAVRFCAAECPADEAEGMVTPRLCAPREAEGRMLLRPPVPPLERDREVDDELP